MKQDSDYLWGREGNSDVKEPGDREQRFTFLVLTIRYVMTKTVIDMCVYLIFIH